MPRIIDQLCELCVICVKYVLGSGLSGSGDSMKIVIILPTYNEKENIGLMIRALQEQFAKIRHDMNILVVDDNSPDGTADVVQAGGGKRRRTSS